MYEVKTVTRYGKRYTNTSLNFASKNKANLARDHLNNLSQLKSTLLEPPYRRYIVVSKTDFEGEMRYWIFGRVVSK